ncbi:hypothetical protein [Streptomyces chrestomyceticus]|uniref:hypothetical protein n=1 Tax=Streptomyces chrestomyceticus TaxID=68185 RepID=UPI0033C38E84
MKNDQPAVGCLAYDTDQQRVGQVMGHLGAYVQLRPPGGGREWDARPEALRSPTPSELPDGPVRPASETEESR